jgi:glutaredoxin
MSKERKKVDVHTFVTLAARRLGRHYYLILLAAVALTVVSVLITQRLRFNSDLADLLPEDNQDLRVLRRIQAKYATDTGFMVLISRNYVFAVDDTGVVHVHDGKRWVRTPLGRPLHALWGLSTDRVFAAGDGGTVVRFDGRRWAPFPAPTKACLRGLWGDKGERIYAVGDAGTVLRFDGKSWHRLPSPTDRHLRTVSGSGDELYAAGDGGTVLRLHGPEFRVEPTPTNADLLGIFALGRGEAVAVGHKGTFLVRQAGRWRALPSGVSETLRGVWGSRLGNVQAVGDRGTVLHFNGSRIRRQSSGTETDLVAIHGGKYDDVWSVGKGCTVRRWDWEWYGAPYDTPDEARPSPPCGARLTAVWRPPADIRRAKALAPTLAAALERSPNVSRVDYRKPVQFFWDRALMFSRVEDLERLRDHIEENLERETAKGTGLYVDLEEDRSKKSRRELQRLYKKYQSLAASFGISEWYEHPDGHSLGLVVYPARGVSDFARLRELWTEIAGIVARLDYKKSDPLLRIDVGGDAVDKIREYDATIDDVFGKIWLAVVGIILLMLIYFRRLLGLFFVALPLGMSIAWTFALTTLSIGTLNAVTGFLFAVLFGLGIDYGLQLYARYREGRSAGLSVDDAMNHVILDTGRATLTSALTTAVALLTLTVTDFKGFSEFGFIAGIGVLLALVSFILVMPAMILLAERLRILRIFGATELRFEYDNRKLRPVQPEDEIQRRCSRTLGRSFNPTLLVADTREQLEAAVATIRRDSERLGKRSAVKYVLTILDLVPGRQHEKKVILEEIDELLHDKRWKMVSDRAKRRIRLDKLREMSKAEPFTLRELPPDARRGFKGPGFGEIWLAMVFHAIDLAHTKQARILKDQVGDFKGTPWVNLLNLLPPGARLTVEGRRAEITCPEPKERCTRAAIDRLQGLKHNGKPVLAHVVTTREAYRRKLAVTGGLRGDLLVVSRPEFLLRAARGEQTVQPSGTFHVSSGELVLAEVVEVLLRDGRIAFVLSISAIFLAALLDFRSLRSAALACLPLLVGLLWTFGVMSLINLKLNLFNFVILPALLGIGIDYGVHYTHRYQSEGEGNLGRVMRALYWVIFFCAATTIVGFGNMALAEHPGLRSLGQLAIIGLACMFFASTYTLPATLYVLERIRGVRVPVSAPTKGTPDVVVYATSYCPSCRLVRRFLADRNVPFSYVELDELPAEHRRRLAEEIIGATGANALPVTKVGARYVVGFAPDDLLEAVGSLK